LVCGVLEIKQKEKLGEMYNKFIKNLAFSQNRLVAALEQ
jgi:hypothetical protein